jgi:fatty-acyl-CoA synthase
VLRDGASASEADIIATCRDRLAGFKSPKSVYFVDEIPKNVSGKILKRNIRDDLASKVADS